MISERLVCGCTSSAFRICLSIQGVVESGKRIALAGGGGGGGSFPWMSDGETVARHLDPFTFVAMRLVDAVEHLSELSMVVGKLSAGSKD